MRLELVLHTEDKKGNNAPHTGWIRKGLPLCSTHWIRMGGISQAWKYFSMFLTDLKVSVGNQTTRKLSSKGPING